jgi:Methylase involved in ubiquinone/menaquinone biosynthesis
MGRVWVSETAAANDRAITLLAVAPGDRVLEIGFGPGRAVSQLAVAGAHVTGVDASPVMLAQARRRNAAALRAEQVELLTGHAGALPLPDATVDAVLAVHTLYFWADLTGGLRETRRVLAPSGRVVLAFRAAEDGVRPRFDPAVYRVPTTRALQRALDTAGFETSTVERDPHGITHVLARVAARSDTASIPEPADTSGR